MTNSNLLKEAIADAKAVRETALANAKIALEEAFTPRIQSMLSARIAEEEELDMEEDAEAPEMEAPIEEPVAAEGRGMNDADEDPTDEFSEEMAPEELPVEEDDHYAAEEPPLEEDGEEDLELEAIIRELEDEMADEETPPEAPVTEEEEVADEAPVTEEGGDEEDVSLEEIIKALREEEGEEEVTEEAEEGEATKELEEAITVIKFLRSKINEVNLLNAKLLFSNKLFRNHSMNESQKMKVIENFDRASNLREVKLVFATLAESFKVRPSRTKRTIKESYASKSSRSTAPRKKVISEGAELAARWKKLANL
tara:strand:+ start:1375 stop:2310 length:936 start_codon:yes stop_codon:yes gene_type:complete